MEDSTQAPAVTKDASGAVCYTLESFHGPKALADAIVDEHDEVLILSSYESAVETARLILEDAERPNGPRFRAPDSLPAVGLMAHDHADPFKRYDDRDDDPQSWSAGWVQKRDGEITVHEDVTEESEDLWDWIFGIIHGR